MRPEILIFPQAVQLNKVLTQSWFEIARRSIQARGRFTVALCGGTTPKAFYRYIAKQGNNPLWQHSHVFVTDERFVGMSHQENNGKMIRESLLKNAKIPRDNIHFVNTDMETVQSSARGYESELKRFFRFKNGSLPKFDLILLGIGEDGHTASLFPSVPMARRALKRCIVYCLNPAKTQWRISLSLPAINRARNVFFLVTGTKKASVIKKVFCDKHCRLPAALVDPKRGQVKVFLDVPAAYLLNL